MVCVAEDGVYCGMVYVVEGMVYVAEPLIWGKECKGVCCGGYGEWCMLRRIWG